MDLSHLLAYLPVIFREFWEHKFKVLLCIGVISMAVLAVGMGWKANFKTSATLFADNQNILKPLLAQSAAVNQVENQIRVVRDAISAPRLLRSVVESIYPPEEFESAADVERTVSMVRDSLQVQGLGGSHIKISFEDNSPERAYDVLNAVIDKFIKESSDDMRSDSKEAFQFIDSQVKQYKNQLVSAEEQLKQFKARNFDGREADVDGRIASLRSSLEEMKINMDEERTRVDALRKRLESEDRTLVKSYKSDVYKERLVELQNRIDNLLLTYQESYPDVVNLRLQMEDITVAMMEAQASQNASSDNSSEQGVNPYYEELRSRLLDAEVGLSSGTRRMQATEQLLEAEYKRRERIAAHQAELSELTRDYTVTKRIYDDMLERKEKARLSMTLSIEGQGVNYKIQEPAEFPLKPEGLRFLHFVLLGPILGLLVPMGLVVAYVIVDYRIRFPWDPAIRVPVLAVTPHVRTRFSQRVIRTDFFWLVLLILVLGGSYIGLALAHREGIIG